MSSAESFYTNFSGKTIMQCIPSSLATLLFVKVQNIGYDIEHLSTESLRKNIVYEYLGIALGILDTLRIEYIHFISP